MSAIQGTTEYISIGSPSVDFSLRPVHPVAPLIKAKYQEYYTYRLPDGNPCWEPDDNDNGKIKRFSSPSVRHVSSFKNQKGNCSFSEWILYFLKNQQELWYDYSYW